MNTDHFEIRMYTPPGRWMEYTMYVCTLIVFAQAVYTGIVYYTAVLAACLLYWNYLWFRLMRKWIDLLNENEIKKLADFLDTLALNEHKDGTFQDTECLTKESSDEENS